MTILLSQDDIRDNIVSCIPRTFAGCSWPASVRLKERPSLLVKSRDIAGLKIVISRVVKRGLEAGVGVGVYFIFLFKECCFLAIYRLRMAVLSACPKCARTSSEAPISSQFHCPLPSFLCAPDQNHHATRYKLSRDTKVILR